MKKLVFMFVAIATVSFASCGSNKTAETAADSTNVETAVCDSACDSAACDSAVCDSAACDSVQA